MNKLLLNNKGFMIIELLIVLGIVSMILIINSIFLTNNDSIMIIDTELKILNNKLISNRQYAINNVSKVDIFINDNSIEFKSDNLYDKTVFKTINFKENINLHFNKYGVINQAKTINFKQLTKQYRLIFYLGKGWYKIE